MTTRKRPASARILGQWVDAYARQHGQPPARVRNWVSHMVLGGALERAGFEAEGRRFTIKGGVALELRLRHLARATKDLDLTLMSEGADLGRELASALANPYQGFTFRVRDEPEVMPNGASRLEVSLQYLGKGWGTVQVDVGPREGSTTEVEMVEAISLAPFGLDGPETLPCLSLPYHVAQKIHAMTLPEQDGRRSDRFRDLIDLLLLREWVTDLEVVRRACIEVFETRGTHPWPPVFTPPEHWLEPFDRMAGEVQIATRDVFEAASEVRNFLSTMEPTADWLPEVALVSSHGLTTWYFAVTSDRRINRIRGALGEAVFSGVPPARLSQRESDLLREMDAIFGVTVILNERRPEYVGKVSRALLNDRAEINDGTWDHLAIAIFRRTKITPRGQRSFGEHLRTRRGADPAYLAPIFGVQPRYARTMHLESNREQILWDLRRAIACRRAAHDAYRTVRTLTSLQ